MIAKFFSQEENSNSSIEFIPKEKSLFIFSTENDFANYENSVGIEIDYDDISELLDFLIKIQSKMNHE